MGLLSKETSFLLTITWYNTFIQEAERVNRDLQESRYSGLAKIARTYGLGLVYLFGSQSHLGKEYLEGLSPEPSDPLADLDIGVVLLDCEHFRPNEISPLERADLYGDLTEFQDLFSPFKVDLVLLDETHSVFQSEAISGFCVYCRDQDLREDYEERILARAADFKPFLDLFHRERLEDRYDKPHPH